MMGPAPLPAWLAAPCLILPSSCSGCSHHGANSAWSHGHGCLASHKVSVFSQKKGGTPKAVPSSFVCVENEPRVTVSGCGPDRHRLRRSVAHLLGGRAASSCRPVAHADVPPTPGKPNADALCLVVRTLDFPRERARMQVSLQTARNHRSLVGRHGSHLYALWGSIPGPVTSSRLCYHAKRSSWAMPQTPA